ncbi:MAG: hypothetical protein ACOYOU_11760 [Kiritimatiellia bacterium]
MGKFLEFERDHQARFKQSATGFSGGARQNGAYAGKPRPFCLPPGLAKENLFAGSRRRP